MKHILSFFFILFCSITFAQTPYALELDGTDDYVLMGDVNDLGTSDFTVEAWFYAESYGTNGGKIINKGETAVGTPAEAGYGIRFGHSSMSRIDANIHGATGPYYDLYCDTIQFDTWYHVAMVRRFDKFMLYVNCILVDSMTIPPNVNVDTDMPLGIGGKDKGGLSFNDNFHDGYIDEVRIWTVARTESEICTWKDCTIDGPVTGLLAVYNMDHQTGTIASDNSGNGNDGTLQDQATWAPSTIGANCYLNFSESNLKDSEFGIYPMPVDQELIIDGLNENCDYKIYSTSGKLVQNGKYLAGQSIALDKVEPGMYFICVQTVLGQVSMRFLKE